VIWTARWMIGLRSEVRGTPPTGEVMIAAKHQSFLDILLIFHAIPRGKFIMKRELLFAPILGQYAWRIGCVPVDRGKRGQAIAKMMRDVEAGLQSPGQLVIYPQGTRVAPGVSMPYKIGTGLLYEQLGQPCIPVAANVGVFWPKRAILRKPGLAVVEFLDPIAPGLPKDQFMARMSASIEERSNALMAEAGFQGGRDDLA
jgi:1-acyl-sn-glycerol-3-phosphate acyltransferase